MNKRLSVLILPAVALALEALPWGAVLNFANPEGTPFRQTFSYFSMIPFGYANFGPFLTALLTSAGAILMALYSAGQKKGLLRAGKYVLSAAAVCSLTPLLFGLSNFSLIGALISLALIGQVVLLYCLERK